MFFGLKAEVIKSLGLARIAAAAICSDYAVRAREFSHHQAATAVGADKAAEDGVRNAGHRREYGGRCDLNRTDVKCFRKRNICPHLSILSVTENCRR